MPYACSNVYNLHMMNSKFSSCSVYPGQHRQRVLRDLQNLFKND
jgi:hypothetical protein